MSLKFPLKNKKNNYTKNMKDLMEMPFEINDKSIFMEDDIVVQKSFLQFMNLYFILINFK